MKKDTYTDSAHAEHKHLLDALENNLKDEVERGLKLLDTCASQIGQARWILVNVNNTIKDYYTDCPVCETNKGKSGTSKSKGKEPVKPASVPKKDPPPASLFILPATKISKPAVVAKVTAKPSHRPGPRSKTRPNDVPIPTVPGVHLPKKKTIIVNQTAIKVRLNNISPYLRGATTIDLADLRDFDPCTQERVEDLHFKPLFIRTTSGKVSKYTALPKHPPKKSGITLPAKPVGLASKKFIEGLSKDRNNTSTKKYISREIISDSDGSSDSSEDYKPLIKLKTSKKSKRDSPSKKKSSSKHSEHKHKEKEKEKNNAEKSKSGPASMKSNPVPEKVTSTSSSHSKPASTRMTITLKTESDSVFDKIKEKTSSSTTESVSKQPKMIDFTKRESSTSRSSHHAEVESDGSSIGKPSAVKIKTKPGPASKKIKNSPSSNSHAGVDMEPCLETKPPVFAVKSRPGPASKKKVFPDLPPAPSSIMSEASIKSDAESVHSLPASQKVPVEVNGVNKPEKDGEATLKRKLSPDSSTVEPQPATKKKVPDKVLTSAFKANLLSKLQNFAKKAGPASKTAAKKVENVVTTTTEPEPVRKEDKEDDGMELGDDIIGKCMDDLEKEKNASPDSPTKPKTIKNRPPSFSLSTSPPPTLQDCISPTGVDKFFKGPSPPANEEPLVDSPSAKLMQISRAQELLKRLSHSKFEKVAALHSQDKISELFAGLSRGEVKTERRDLHTDTWYLVDDETLGYASSSNSVAAIQWSKIPEDKFKSILAELETYTLSCIR